MNALEVIFSSKQTANNLFGENNSKAMDGSFSLFNTMLKNEKNMTAPEVSKAFANTENDKKLIFDPDAQALTLEEYVIEQFRGDDSSDELNLQSDLNEISPEISQLVEEIITSIQTLTKNNDAAKTDSEQPIKNLGENNLFHLNSNDKTVIEEEQVIDPLPVNTISTDVELVDNSIGILSDDLSLKEQKIITSTKDYGLENDSVRKWHIAEPLLTNKINESMNLDDSSVEKNQQIEHVLNGKSKQIYQKLSDESLQETPQTQIKDRSPNIITISQNFGDNNSLSVGLMNISKLQENLGIRPTVDLNQFLGEIQTQKLQSIERGEPNKTAIQQQNQKNDSEQLLIPGNPPNVLMSNIVKLIETVSPGTIVKELPTKETDDGTSLIVDLNNLPEVLVKQILQLTKLLEKSTLENEQFDNSMVQGLAFVNDVSAVPQFLHNQSETKAVQPLVNQADESVEKLIWEASSLLSQVKTEKDIPKLTPKLLELLQQWSALEKQNIKSGNYSTLQAITGDESSKEQLVWKDLVEVFQRRQDIAAKQVYNTDSKVNTRDVAKWLGNALEKHSHSERILNQTIEFMPSTSMQKLEQYTIHINRSKANDTTSTSQQVMDQFQSVMKSSKFLTMLNGSSQLSITLNPNNLGEMRLRLTQIDGEMTVKILVTSQATKDILESNISQLKHMFSPNQVVIEKLEQVMQQNSEQMKEPKDQQMNQQEENNSNHQEQLEQHHVDNEFETQFRELLNEKV